MKPGDAQALDGELGSGLEAPARTPTAAADPDPRVDLDQRILQAEQAVIRRDEAWLAQLHRASQQGADVARQGAGWAAGGLALLGVMLLVRAALRSGSRPHPHVTGADAGSVRKHRRQPGRAGAPGWATLASALALATPLLPIGVRGWVGPLTGLVNGRGWTRLGASVIERLARPRRSAAPHATDSSRSPRSAHAGPPQRPPVRTVAGIEMRRYAGDWFEIARLASRSSAMCAGAVTTRYRTHGSGLAVAKRCVDQRGRVLQFTGEAQPIAGSAGARLKVTFAPSWLRALPWAWREHCILLIDPDYQYALVGTPDRAALWLLARSPTLQRSALLKLVECAEAQGFDIERLQHTPH